MWSDYVVPTKRQARSGRGINPARLARGSLYGAPAKRLGGGDYGRVPGWPGEHLASSSPIPHFRTIGDHPSQAQVTRMNRLQGAMGSFSGGGTIG